ncbi:MAG: AAA-like domain-containing protein [Cyanobacteriota bacterium]|nr:AAA-like domain-containing protein [Cyanobacteriota bacterium]
MNADEALEIVELQVLSRQLSPIERLIFSQSWQGKGYMEMAQGSGYNSNYFKEVGSRLWHNLSEVMGQKVSKKNLQIVFKDYQPNSIDTGDNIAPSQLFTQALVEETVKNNFPESINYSLLIEKNSQFPNQTVFTHIKFPNGPVPLNSPLYIKRPPVEELVLKEVHKPGCVIRIKAPKKMGKSSLLHRIIAHTQTSNYKTVYIDFQEADNIVFDSLDKFLRWFCANVTRQLNIIPKLDDYWDEDMGSKVSCKIYFETYLLSQINSPVILALNEVNQIFEYPTIARDFLPMLRFWYEIAQQLESWQKLRMVVAHTTESYVPLHINQSPFNVGLAIALPYFTSEQVQELAKRYGLNWENITHTQQLMEMVGGHPYLINLALYYLCQEEMTLFQLLEKATTQTGIYSNHLRSHLLTLRQQPELAAALTKVIDSDSSVEIDAIIAYKLESMGLIKLDGNLSRPSCELYRLYFQENLSFS